MVTYEEELLFQLQTVLHQDSLIMSTVWVAFNRYSRWMRVSLVFLRLTSELLAGKQITLIIDTEGTFTSFKDRKYCPKHHINVDGK